METYQVHSRLNGRWIIEAITETKEQAVAHAQRVENGEFGWSLPIRIYRHLMDEGRMVLIDERSAAS
jgi:hypothetical protein